MLDELTFRKYADAAIESLKKSLIVAEEESDFDAEEQNGVLNIVFDEPWPAFFVAYLLFGVPYVLLYRRTPVGDALRQQRDRPAATIASLFKAFGMLIVSWISVAFLWVIFFGCVTSVLRGIGSAMRGHS